MLYPLGSFGEALSMIVGIVGKGKMGKDIFDNLLRFDYQLILICRKFEDIDPLVILIEKQINKMHKRGYLNYIEYEKKLKSFKITNDLSALKCCDLVIESVIESKTVKQELFQRIESIVSKDCILATNTSSIPLRTVFKNCAKKNRCIGIHCFYPVKIINIAEINKLSVTDNRYVETVKKFLKYIGKNAIVLEEQGNMILTKMFTILITQIYNIYEDNYLRIEEIDKLVKSSLLTFGLFEIIDSTGVNIIIECIQNFIDDRYRKIYTPFYKKGNELLQKGFPGGKNNKGITAYEKENIKPFKSITDDQLEKYKKDIILLLQSLIINETAFIILKNYAGKDDINQAIKEVFGLIEDPITMYNRIGEQKIGACLLDYYERFHDNVYLPLELSTLLN